MAVHHLVNEVGAKNIVAFEIFRSIEYSNNLGKIISKRRIFIKKNDDFAQIFSFNQEQDGSIYCSMPEFSNIKWMNLVNFENVTGMIISDSVNDTGKLSIHGSGMTTFRAHSEPKGHKLIVKV